MQILKASYLLPVAALALAGACFAQQQPTSGTQNDPVKTSPQDTPKTPDPASVKADDAKAVDAAKANDRLPQPGESLDPKIKKGSEDDVDAVGTRNIGGRGMGKLVFYRLGNSQRQTVCDGD